MGMTLFTYTT